MNRERKALGAGQRFTTNKPRREKETKKYDYKTKYYQPANERRWNSWKDEKLVQLVENFKSKGEEIDYEYLSSYFKQHQGCIRRRYNLLAQNRLLIPTVQQNLVKLVSESIQQGNNPDWDVISQQIGAAPKDCERQYGKCIEQTWNKQSEQKLVKLIQVQKEAGQINWLDIGQQLGNITGKACMQHYTRMHNNNQIQKQSQ